MSRYDVFVTQSNDAVNYFEFPPMIDQPCNKTVLKAVTTPARGLIAVGH